MTKQLETQTVLYWLHFIFSVFYEQINDDDDDDDDELRTMTDMNTWQTVRQTETEET